MLSYLRKIKEYKKESLRARGGFSVLFFGFFRGGIKIK
jgi:hypothetical protein